MSFEISELWIYPVKGLGGIAMAQASLSDRGFVDDRRWMVVDAASKFMSQRAHPQMAQMAQVAVTLNAVSLTLAAPGMPPLRIARQAALPALCDVQVWDSVCAAHGMGPAADAWLSRYLGVPCRLVYMPDSTHRAVSPKRAKPGDIVSFADGYPFLLTHEASLADLNARLATPIGMKRFRPNIVVRGAARAWDEDAWKRVHVDTPAGQVSFRVVKPCGRCVVINVDPTTAQRGKEPLRTLAGFRRQGNAVIFGQNLIQDSAGTLAVGDAVSVVR